MGGPRSLVCVLSPTSIKILRQKLTPGVRTNTTSLNFDIYLVWILVLAYEYVHIHTYILLLLTGLYSACVARHHCDEQFELL